jgi:cytochrome subunit of sulfide dehydrogenase
LFFITVLFNISCPAICPNLLSRQPDLALVSTYCQFTGDTAMHVLRFKIQLAMALCLACIGFTAAAQTATDLNARSLAATCANCHGTDGRSIEGAVVPSLAGMPKAYMLAQMKAFKDGTRPATIMHQLSKGYSDQQVEALATYFSALKR